ncbi:MAG: hypothetical protein DRO40_00490 [Thermoprotei archaeon]|nr:MAG: hypothetical protein DRO40_00490 [Thermoprotei archaeon]
MDKDIERKLIVAGVGRFQVMALLQAARYYVFYKDIDRAKSFGLNRAIFYAWAKYHGPHTMRWKTLKLEEIIKKGRIKPHREKCPENMEEVLGECVEVSSRGYYVIGGKEQSPKDYDEYVVKKISRIIDYERAWKAALEYVNQFPEQVLRDQQKFYKLVYEPIRDIFFKQIIMNKELKPSRIEISDRTRSYIKEEKANKKQKTLYDFIS